MGAGPPPTLTMQPPVHDLDLFQLALGLETPWRVGRRWPTGEWTSVVAANRTPAAMIACGTTATSSPTRGFSEDRWLPSCPKRWRLG